MESLGPPEELQTTPQGEKKLIANAHPDTLEYTPQEFAKAAVDFYQTLIELEVEKEFAEKLTVAFIGRL